MSDIVYYWYTFADGYSCCVRGFDPFELQTQIDKHGNLVKKERAR